MFSSNKLNDQIIITQDKLGNGAFGSVYIAKINNRDVAVKCENKEKNDNLTLLREFKIGRKIFMIKKYLKYLSASKGKNDKNDKNDKLLDHIKSLEINPAVKIYNYITMNNLLSIPEEFDINLLIKTTCVPENYSYMECEDYNFLTMELCGNNIENMLEKYTLSEQTKYNIAYRLLYVMSCIHRCGIIHRDIKLSNFVFNNNPKSKKDYYPIIIDLGLAKEFYKYEGGKVLQMTPYTIRNITGTLRYISLNIHEYKSPSIVDDLISLCYALVVIFTDKQLPWVGHVKDIDKFDSSKHTFDNCKCNYHKNKEAGTTKKKNTIAEMKFHTSLEELTGNKYEFLVWWIRYLYSLKPKQLPSYNLMLKKLLAENPYCSNMFIDITEKN
jgi:serine/threonine protein kinase